MKSSSTAAARETVRLPFRDRAQAGRLIGSKLRLYADHADVIVAALPRGGVPVAEEIAQVLHAPLSVFLVRKLGVPGHEELAMGSISSGGTRFINQNLVSSLHIPENLVESVAAREVQELLRREQLYGRGQPSPDFRNKSVILVDDGIATGATMRLAVQAMRDHGARRVIAAVPVAPHDAVNELRGVADAVVCLAEPPQFAAVGQWYEDFRQVSDVEVCQILDRMLEPASTLRSA